MSIQVKLDPFFDEEPIAPGNTPSHAPRQTPGPTANYLPASAMEMANGRTAAQVMRPARGLVGALIPAGTEGGVPEGFNPHDVSNISVVIDPHLPGQSRTVKLGEITPERMAEAMQTASRTVPAPRTLAARRMQAAATFHALGQMQAEADARDQSYEPLAEAPPPTAPAVRSAPVTHEYQGQVAPQAVQRPRMSPMAAFRTPTASLPPAAAVASPAAPVASVPAAVANPSKRVIFELQLADQSSQTMEAWYHDVQFIPSVEEPKNVLLVYDTRFRGTKWFPTGTLKLAMELEGDGRAHLVYPTGLHYLRGDDEFCMLLVEKSALLEE